MSRRRYPWRRYRERWDLVMMGDPDCHAYIIRYGSKIGYGQAWCWLLYMPRGCGRDVARGWARSGHEAKRQVEAAIQEYSR